jgi:hypothetical protein
MWLKGTASKLLFKDFSMAGKTEQLQLIMLRWRIR